ncbi:MAG: class I SAM-dependent methyltransferase [Bacteroidetes bacterium]|nr:class I SAM-dependent methyltransferase [Bacteroidota bacterium]
MNSFSELQNANTRKAFFDALASSWNLQLSESDLNYIRTVLHYTLPSPSPFCTILDVGCGTGALFPLLENYNVVALDFSQQMLRVARSRGFKNVRSYVCTDAHSLPFIEEYFAAALMFNVFPHFTDPQRALHEVSRVLIRGGKLAIFHLHNRTSISKLHQSIGGPIAYDTLPDEPIMEAMLQNAHLKIDYKENTSRYAIVCRKE